MDPSNLTNTCSHLHRDAIRWQLHHGRERVNSLQELEGVNIVITTYQTLVAEFRRNESNLMFSVSWRRLVLDEGER